MSITQTAKEVNFEKFSHEANAFINTLSDDLGHPDEQKRAYRLLRAVLWTVRDRIQIAESFDLISEFPVLLRGVYTQGWKYHEKPPLNYDTIEEMTELVKKQQGELGEDSFHWDKSTEELIAVVIDSLKEFVSQSQMDHVREQMPKEIKALVK